MKGLARRKLGACRGKATKCGLIDFGQAVGLTTAHGTNSTMLRNGTVGLGVELLARPTQRKNDNIFVTSDITSVCSVGSMNSVERG
jgi:hypothetical protein